MADQGAEGWLSPWLRMQRIKAAQPYLSRRVLDFGCGSGALEVKPPLPSTMLLTSARLGF